MKKKIVAFFDFDGTITKKDSFVEFIKFIKGKRIFIKGIITLSPILILYKLKFISNNKAKQKVISYFFKGYKKSYFKSLANEFSLNYIDKIVNPKMIKIIKWHKNKGHKVVIVSASLECYLKPWCEKNDLELIATRLESKDGIITGNFLTENCYGKEKVKRIRELYNLNQFDYIYAYGDSEGDKYMLKLADKSFYLKR
jgi:phosphatidylglycerophosphatase C